MSFHLGFQEKYSGGGYDHDIAVDERRTKQECRLPTDLHGEVITAMDILLWRKRKKEMEKKDARRTVQSSKH
ncbi:MAG: hypothetical protein WC364_11950 [Eubacteriales bacterium]|jgi:hypothetical protein